MALKDRILTAYHNTSAAEPHASSIVAQDKLAKELGDAIGNGTAFLVTQASQPSGGFSILDVVRFDSTISGGPEWVLARADIKTTVGTHIVVDIASGNQFTLAQSGRFDIGAHGLTIGVNFFLSITIEGLLTETEPTTGFSNLLVFVESSTVIHVTPFRAKDTTEAGELPGVIKQYGGSSAPAGYLLCDGAEISKTTFADLFAVIGTAFDDSPAGGNFNVPDIRGRYPVGLSSDSGAELGAEVGIVLSDKENRAVGQHDHSVTDSGHTHGPLAPMTSFLGSGTGATVGPGATVIALEPTTGSAVTGLIVDNEGSVVGTNAPYIQLNYIIKT